MWNNGELKKEAKFHLGGSYGTGLLVVLIVALISSLIRQITGAVSGLYTALYNSLNDPYLHDSLGNASADLANIQYAAQIMKATLIVALVSEIANIFLLDPLNVSVNFWFIRNRESALAPGVDKVFNHFSSNYTNLLKGTLWELLWRFIWSLPLYAISGCIYFVSTKFSNLQDPAVAYEWSYSLDETAFTIVIILTLLSTIYSFVVYNRLIAYSMAKYILADNPEIGGRKALNLSKKMMKGNKWHYVGLNLSFIGWYFLAFFVMFGLGNIFVNPYRNQTMAELYASLRTQAVQRGDVTMEELGFYKSNAYNGQGVYEAEFTAQNPNLDPYSANWNNSYASNSESVNNQATSNNTYSEQGFYNAAGNVQAQSPYAGQNQFNGQNNQEDLNKRD